MQEPDQHADGTTNSRQQAAGLQRYRPCRDTAAAAATTTLSWLLQPSCDFTWCLRRFPKLRAQFSSNAPWARYVAAQAGFVGQHATAGYAFPGLSESTAQQKQGLPPVSALRTAAAEALGRHWSFCGLARHSFSNARTSMDDGRGSFQSHNAFAGLRLDAGQSQQSYTDTVLSRPPLECSMLFCHLSIGSSDLTRSDAESSSLEAERRNAPSQAAASEPSDDQQIAWRWLDSAVGVLKALADCNAGLVLVVLLGCISTQQPLLPAPGGAPLTFTHVSSR